MTTPTSLLADRHRPDPASFNHICLCGVYWPCDASIAIAAARAAEADRALLREALKAMVKQWGPHSGACCTFYGDGKVIVTPESCVCGPVKKQARAALARTLVAANEKGQG